MINRSQYRGEPAIIDGDLQKNGGDYVRQAGIDNAIYILIGTESGYWANLIEPIQSQIPGGASDLDAEPIDSEFLNRHSALRERQLEPLIIGGIASQISVESFNPDSDRIEWTARIVMSDDDIYFFDSETGIGEFI